MPRLRPGERMCVEPGCPVVLPAPSGKGRPPVRCEEHRARRFHRAAGVRRKLESVPQPIGDDEVFGPGPVTAQTRVSRMVREDLDDLFSAHPAQRTLTAIAVKLAALLDDPVLAGDGRVAAAVAKELRATITDLTRAEESDSDDPFGDAGSAPVVIPSA